jgi:hypothetical protein
MNPRTEQELRLSLILEPTTGHCPPIQLLLPQLPQKRNQRRDAKGMVVPTTNLAAARSVPTTRTGSFHQVSECCVCEFEAIAVFPVCVLSFHGAVLYIIFLPLTYICRCMQKLESEFLK